jgi:hypothetical protein
MHRFVALALPLGLALATLTLAQGRAMADDCLCLGSDLLFEPIDQVETTDVYLDEGELAPTLPSAGPIQVDVTDLAPRATPVLWCLSSDDPRCSRDDDSGEAPYLQILSTPPVILTATPGVPRPGVVRVRFDLTQQHGCAGVQTRLDRPPRA